MHVPLNQAFSAQQYLPWFQQTLPGYKYSTVVGKLAVGHGTWAQVFVQQAPGGVKLVSGMPVLPRILMVLGFLGGLLPGIIIAVVYMAATSGVTGTMKAQLSAALSGQQIPPGPGLPGAAGAAPAAGGSMMPSPETLKALGRVAAPIAGGLLVLLAPLLLCGAWESGKGYAYAADDLACADDTEKYWKTNLARAQNMSEPPAGVCPEEKYESKHDECAYDLRIPPSYTRCHGCTVHFKEPYRPTGKVYKQGSKYLDCPYAATVQSRLDTLERKRRRQSSRATSELTWSIGYGVFAIGFALAGFGAIGGWFYWRRKKQAGAPSAPQAAPASAQRPPA